MEYYNLTNFIIVVVSNIYWFRKHPDDYFDAFKWSESEFLAVALWSYAALGLYSLILFLYRCFTNLY